MLLLNITWTLQTKHKQKSSTACLFHPLKQTVVTSLDCFRHGSTFATHNTPVQTDTTVHTLPTALGANHRASHRQTHTITDMTSPHPESTNTHSIYLYTLLYNLLSVAGASFLLIHWQACVVPDGYQHFIHLFLRRKLCIVKKGSLYTEHMVKGDWKKEKQKRSALHKEWHTTRQIHSLRPTSKTSAKTMHALKMTKFKNRLESAFYFYYFHFLFPILVPLIRSVLS